MPLKVFVKLGINNKNIGACLESQRILMLIHIKKCLNIINNYELIKVNPSKPPESFTNLGLGLRLRIPCIVLDEHTIDDPDEIVTMIENKFPGGLLTNEIENDAEIVTRNFFSKFSFYVRGVAKDSHSLEHEFNLINQHLEKVAQILSNNEGSQNNVLYLCGFRMSLIDCEILPKLHQVRVALKSILDYEIPVHNSYIWRYLNSAYNNSSFVEACCPDEDIINHWSNKKKTSVLSGKDSAKPLYSFSIPVRAERIVIDD